MNLGKKIRLNRIFNSKSGKILAVALDHPIGRGVLPGIGNIEQTMEKVIEGGPDSLTMHKGIATHVLSKFTDCSLPCLFMKCSTFSPYQPTRDTLVANVEEALALGADAISIGVILGGEEQPEQLQNLAGISREATKFGLPLVVHIYPKGDMVKDPFAIENVKYAARTGAELGVDIVKTLYTGSSESFRKVIDAVPVPVVIAGGEAKDDLRARFQMTKDALDAGAAGVTYGRSIWQHDNPVAIIKALKVIIHDNESVDTAMDVFEKHIS